jgi:hypothetical protein
VTSVTLRCFVTFALAPQQEDPEASVTSVTPSRWCSPGSSSRRAQGVTSRGAEAARAAFMKKMLKAIPCRAQESLDATLAADQARVLGAPWS